MTRRPFQSRLPGPGTARRSLSFFQKDTVSIIGRLASNCDFPVRQTQRDAWLEQIRLLQGQLLGLNGSVFLEFSIPRMGRRIDAVLLINSIVFVIEFKVGDSVFDRAAVDQVWDYALDLKNFHEASHSASIVPILVATAASASPPLRAVCGRRSSLPSDFGVFG